MSRALRTTSSVPLDAARPDSAYEFIRFHARHKLLLMAHAPAAVSRLGRIVAQAGTADLDDLWRQYVVGAAETLSRPPSRGGHVNALQHAVGYFRGLAIDARRQAIAQAIADYSAGGVSLALPMRLIREAAAEYNVGYLVEQVYLDMAEAFDVA